MSSDPTSPVAEYLRTLHADLSSLTDGEVATSIPAFGRADRQSFGICLATVDGQLYEVGDTRLPFTVQSISKPFAYGLALAAAGAEAVGRKVGIEPSAEAGDVTSPTVEQVTGRPLNPVVNAGAISVAGLLAGSDPTGAATAIVEALARFVGRPLEVDADVYAAEREHWWRDAEAAAKLRRSGVLEVDPAVALDLYYRQSAVRADCRDLAVMAATLANGGINPVTGTTALPRAATADVLSVMAACGMYDRSGEWVVQVGMPAIGGAAGGLLAVLPGRLGLGIYSPPVDGAGQQRPRDGGVPGTVQAVGAAPVPRRRPGRAGCRPADVPGGHGAVQSRAVAGHAGVAERPGPAGPGLRAPGDAHVRHD